MKALLEMALELEPAKRTSFLDRACAGNPSLRQEINARLPSGPDSNGTQTEMTPASRPSKAAVEPELAPGELIAHYKILAFLGRGGMGEVYLAQDTRLNRKVALKLLPRSLSNDEDRLRRFEREARSASALSHPNVCVIHEIGETSDGRPYISMEYIDGATLRRRFSHGHFKLSEAIDVAQQTASALAAAHEAGVVHRDIKPENIMLRRDGYVKVLDFGLAKLTERYERDTDSEAPTFHVFSTHSGVLLGTTNYLSPEQARRIDVDERADIWALGVVLYEMVAGCLPFTGETASHVIVSILEKEPRPITDFVPAAPSELDWIIRKALRKDRDRRYQTIKELLSDLEDVSKKVSDVVVSGSGQIVADAQVPIERHSSALQSISQTLRQPRFSITFFVLALLIIGLIIWVSVLIFKPPVPPFRDIHVAKLTNTGGGVRNGAVISPDGKSVAYVADDAGRQSLIVSYPATSSTSTIVAPIEGGSYRGLSFSNDGDYLYYIRSEKGDAPLLFQVPAHGGISKQIASNVTGPISFSPNGQQFAFVRFDQIKGEYSLLLARVDTGEERVLAVRNNSNTFSTNGLDWSPDGRSIAIGEGTYGNGYHMRPVAVSIADGSTRAISNQQWFSILQVKWWKDGSGLVFNGAEESVSPLQLWYLSYPKAIAARITNDSSDYYGVSLSDDGKHIVTIQSSRLKSVWVASSDNYDDAAAITSVVGHSYGLAWLPDGRLIYSTMASGNLDLWSLRSDGNQKTQLTANAGANYHPSVSPDGRYIFFSSNRTGSFNIWRMDADGTDLKRLTSGEGDFYPYPTPDGRWVVYQSGGGQNSKPTIWKIGVDGDQKTQISDANASIPVVSPDGRLIACRYWEPSSRVQKIATIPITGGAPTATFDIPIVDWQRVRWTADGSALTYIDTRAGVSNIFVQPLDGRPPKQLTNFKSEQIFSYDWSRNDKMLACERGVETSDVVLLTSSR